VTAVSATPVTFADSGGHEPRMRRPAVNVSIVVPIRNEEATLAEFLQSLLGQHAGADEIVLVDAGSTDGSANVLSRTAKRRDDVHVVEAGAAFPGRARNLGIRYACGEWIALTDAGTILDSNWLTELLTVAAAQPADVVYGTYVPSVTTFLERCVALAFVAPSRPIGGGLFRGPSTASLLIRRRAWEAVGGFPEDLRACEDLEFFDRVAAQGRRVSYAPRARVLWRVPATFGAVFRRFRVYSYHTLKARRGRQWHRAVTAMYLVAGAAVFGAMFVHWSAILIPVAGLAARTMRSVRARPDIADPSAPPGPRTYLTVAALLVWIDAAALAGAVEYCLDRVRRRGGHACL